MKISAIYFVIILGFVACTNSKKNDVILKREPYLQSAIKDSVSVLWRTNFGEISEVWFKQSTSNNWQKIPGVTRNTNTGQIENEVTLNGLEAGKKYDYRIFTDKIEVGDTSYWFISPKSTKDTILKFFAAGDIGEPVDDGGKPDVFGKILSDKVDSFDLGLLLGDIVYPDGESKDYDKYFFQYFKNVFPYIPVFSILGNHDWIEPEKNYMQEWKLPNNEHYYSFDYGKTHIIALDSKKGEFYQFEEQKKWLEYDLASVSSEIEWIIVMVHYNGKSCTYKDDNPHVMSLYPIFEKYNVDMVLNGHAHTYERLKPMDGNGDVVQDQLNNYENPEGFVSITVGSGGKLRGIGSDPEPYTPDPGNCDHPNLTALAAHDWIYLEISIEANQLSGKAIAINTQEVVDEFKIIKN